MFKKQILFFSLLCFSIHSRAMEIPEDFHTVANDSEACLSDAILDHVQNSLENEKNLEEVALWGHAVFAYEANNFNDNSILYERWRTWKEKYKKDIPFSALKSIWSIITEGLKANRVEPYLWASTFFDNTNFEQNYFSIMILEDVVNQAIGRNDELLLENISTLIPIGEQGNALRMTITKWLEKRYEKNQSSNVYDSFFNESPHIQTADEREHEVRKAIDDALRTRDQDSIEQLLKLANENAENPILQPLLQTALQKIFPEREDSTLNVPEKKSENDDDEFDDKWEEFLSKTNVESDEEFDEESDEEEDFDDHQSNPFFTLQIEDAIKQKNIKKLMDLLNRPLSASQRIKVSFALDDLSQS